MILKRQILRIKYLKKHTFRWAKQKLFEKYFKQIDN